MSGTLTIDARIRKRDKPIIYANRYHPNIWALARAENIPTSVALARLELGWTPERIVLTPWLKRKQRDD